jgi:TIR domain
LAAYYQGEKIGMAKEEMDDKRPLVFLSHKSQDADFAQSFQGWIDDNLLGAVRFFVSTDDSSVSLGSLWFKNVEEALSSASLMIVLVTRQSISSNWVFFEAGAAAALGIPLVPVCAGIKISELTPPLSQYQGIELWSDQGHRALLAKISDFVNLRPPKKILKLPLRKEGGEAKSISTAPYQIHHVSVAVSKLEEAKIFTRILWG